VTVDAATILLARHAQLPPRAAAAARVLQLVDDPDTSAQDLARAMGTDPVFAARVLRVANSTYYGLSGKVSTLPFAVSVLGFEVVRSMAVVAAAGLDDAAGAPPGFWPAAALAATGAELVAPIVGASVGDAFALGLLHTIGAALLHQQQELPALCLPEADSQGDLEALLNGERDRYGITHAHLGGAVLTAWHFPAQICVLISRHHDQILPDAEPLERALHCSRLLTDHLLKGRPAAPGLPAQLAWLTQGRLGEAELGPLLERMTHLAAALQEGLRPRR